MWTGLMTKTQKVKLQEEMILFNCCEFHQLMMLLSHSIITHSLCFYFSCLANEIFFFFWRFLFAEAQALLFFCFSVRACLSTIKDSECVHVWVCMYLCMLVKQLVTLIPAATAVRERDNKKHIVWEMGRQPWEDNSCWLENASWLLKANAFSALQPSLRVRMEEEEEEGGKGMRGY